MSKKKRILSFLGRENKREEHRLQMESSRTGYIDEDKLSDSDEREPFIEPKAKAASRNFQSTTQRVCCVRSSKANPFTSGCINFRTSTLTRHVESQDHQNAVKEVHMASNFERAVVNSVALLFLFFQMY